MKILIFILLFCTAQAQAWTGFVAIDGQKSLYVDYVPAPPGRPVLVILNGLTYNTKSWDPMVAGLAGKGFGLLRYDAVAQGETLLKYAPIRNIVPIVQQARDLNSLLEKLGIFQKVDIAGLSYGGGLGLVFAALHPDKIRSLILMAPYVGPLPDQTAWINAQVRAARAANPQNPATDDELFDYFLRINIYQTFPLLEPVVLQNPFILEGCFRMSQGIRKLNVFSLLNHLPAQILHLMVANQDQYIPRSMEDKFWNSLPPSKKMSRINIQGTEHKIPEAVPRFSAAWLAHIVGRDPRLSGGGVFEGNAEQGWARHGSLQIDLPSH